MRFLRDNAWPAAALLAGILLLGGLRLGGILRPAAGQDTYGGKVNAALLDASLEASRSFLLKAQKPEGNFIYEYDYENDIYSESDNAVRQACFFWGLVCNHAYAPSPGAAGQIRKAMRFFDAHSRETADGGRYIAYPGMRTGTTGTVAVYTIALIELMQSEKDPAVKEELRGKTEKYLKFLLSLRGPDGFFHGFYDPATGAGKGGREPYSNTEALLAITKAVTCLGRAELKGMAAESSEVMFAEYFERKPAERIKYYHWGTMAYFEMWQAGWEGKSTYARRILEMADYMVRRHGILKSSVNPAATFEGLVCAWEVARQERNWGALASLDRAIDIGLQKMLAYQVRGTGSRGSPGSPAFGAARLSLERPSVRIDMTQHQTHAFILARKYIFRDRK